MKIRSRVIAAKMGFLSLLMVGSAARAWLMFILAFSLQLGASWPQSTQAAQPQNLPIIDLHLHLDPSWDMANVLALLDRVGVVKAGQSPRGPDSVAITFAKASDRFIPVAGDPLVGLVCPERGGRGQDAWELRVDALLDYLSKLEAGLAAKSFKGIGELQLNRMPGSPNFLCRQPADSPLMRRLWGFSAKYRVPLFVHMDGSDDAIAEIERLLASDRAGTWVWLHSGIFVEPPALRDLLRRHPNLYLELAHRGSVRTLSHSRTLDTKGVLRDDWKKLIEEFPERFFLGSDAPLTAYEDVIRFWRNILGQLTPSTAALLAHGNAQRLLGLSK
jgi:hypothetical protein